MSLKIELEKRQLQFHKPAGTSRGVYLTHDVWYVRMSDPEIPGRLGIGECAPLPDLSCDAGADYESRLAAVCRKLEDSQPFDQDALRDQPSILFGLETAFRQLEVFRHQTDTGAEDLPNRAWALWDTPFSRGEEGIRINGLIWMGNFRDMETQIREKLDKGFTCIKLKIGAIDFEEELDLLRRIRKTYSSETITLRVDANGAFDPSNALEKLKRLSDMDLHSIEQPIRAGQWEVLAGLVKTSPLPIALDEELIGAHSTEQKIKLLDTIDPAYLVLKPSLHGGMSGCEEWVRLARDRSIRWWVTSALESNIGLNAIAQWCATLNNPTHHGLGTGLLYKNNMELPLHILGEELWFRP